MEQNPLDSVTIRTSVSEKREQAHALAQQLNIELVSDEVEDAIQLVLGNAGLSLAMPDLGNPILIDFTQGKHAHRRQFGGGRGQALAKAIGLKKGINPHIIDATAGYGKDAFVLATLGCTVTLIERNPLLAVLLEDAIDRALQDDNTHDIAKRMTLVHNDAIHYLANIDQDQKPDVVYIDPMYPGRQKSALVKKEMQLLHQLIGPDQDSAELLTAATQAAKKRVTVKRPKSAQPLIGKKPSAHVDSKNTRYDIYT